MGRKASSQLAWDDNGDLMELMTINLMCPIQYIQEARQISVWHIVNIEECVACKEEETLPVELFYKKNKSHYLSIILAYNNTARYMNATMTAEFLNGKNWVSDEFFYLEDKPDEELIKSKFCFVIGDTKKLLNYINLKMKS